MIWGTLILGNLYIYMYVFFLNVYKYCFGFWKYMILALFSCEVSKVDGFPFSNLSARGFFPKQCGHTDGVLTVSVCARCLVEVVS